MVLDFQRTHCGACNDEKCKTCLGQEEGIRHTLSSLVKLSKGWAKKAKLNVTEEQRACWFMFAQVTEAIADVLALSKSVGERNKAIGHTYNNFLEIFKVLLKLASADSQSTQLVDSVGLALANLWKNHFRTTSSPSYLCAASFLAVAKLIKKNKQGVETSVLLKSVYYDIFQNLKEALPQFMETYGAKGKEMIDKLKVEVQEMFAKNFEETLKRTRDDNNGGEAL
ncbi:hypothetical protein TL16_g11490 [Triparma laevis f. inornata]|uniref:Uncharacterized protein n=1 Tax=Triparma laevis f. inornata TaxID=1714386 RepID=A0A9W7BFM2_9STRA|nr:hypothetical protein TL16_g11490 [Triparma laevis f. inornata]